MRRLHLVLCAAVCCASASFAGAEEGSELFLLPETPPTIERTLRPSMDRPLLKKQNFVSDYDVSPPPLLINVSFASFAPSRKPAALSLRAGSFASRAAEFAFASQRGWNLGFLIDDTEGEHPLLARTETRFTAGYDRYLAESVRLRGDFSAGERKIADQRHDRFALNARTDWYVSPTLILAAGAGAESSAVRGQDYDDHGAALLSGTWQPGDRHSVSLSYEPEQDTAFDACRDFHAARLMYRVTPFETVMLSAGAGYQKDRFFPSAEAVWFLRHTVRLSLVCDPGFEKPSWADLYAGDRYVLVNRGLRFPQSTWSFREKLSWYSGESASADLEFSQGLWRDYLYWSAVPATNYITPVNAAEEYVSGITLRAARQGRLMTESISVTRNSAAHLPLVPEYSGTASVGVTVSSVTVTGSYTAVSPRYFAFADPRQLAAYGDLALKLAWRGVPGGEIFASVANILGQDIEVQPGFRRNAVYFEAGISAAF